jgi:hypothetical protein
MHYAPRRYHRMQKHKFTITCPSALLMETTSVPPQHEKWGIDVSRPGGIGMHYVTRKSHRMQKHKCGIMCRDGLLLESVALPIE